MDEPVGLQLGLTRPTWRRRKESKRHKRMRHAMLAKELRERLATCPPQKFIRRTHIDLTAALNTQAMGFAAPLYSVWGTANDFDDLRAISLGTTYIPALIPVGNQQDQKTYYTSANQVLTIYNTHASATANVTIYKYHCKAVCPISSMNTLFNTVDFWPNLVQATSATLGTSPFDFRDITKHITIEHQREAMIPVGQQIELNFGVKRNKVFDCNTVDPTYTANGVVGLPGWTCGYFVRLHGVPGLTTIDAAATSIAMLTINTYMARMQTDVVTATTINELL